MYISLESACLVTRDTLVVKSHVTPNFERFMEEFAHNNNNNNNNPICKAPECQKTSVALSGQEQSCELNRIKSPTE